MKPTVLALPTERITLLLIGAMLLLVRVPFYLTHHIQEGSFLIFRTAVNLADHGSYAYNVGTQDTGVTCHAYAFLVALLRLLFRTHFIIAVQLANTLLVIGGIYFFAAAVETKFLPKVIIWIMASMTPLALLASYVGMETPLLIFALGLTLYSLHNEQAPSWLFSFPIFFLPWIRPDAVAFGAILVTGFSLRHRRIHYQSLCWLLAGCASLSAFNFLLTGHLLNQTIIAKKIAYPSDKSVGAVLKRIPDTFFTHSIYSPLGKALPPLLSMGSAVLAFSAIAISLWISRKDRGQWTIFLILGAIAVLVPLPYIYEGMVEFPWYFAVSSFTGLFLVITLFTIFALRLPIRARIGLFACASLALVAMAVSRAAVSITAGAECQFMSGIGRFIKETAQPTDTLFLEPAGIIPYYAGIKTYEEVGLSTFNVVGYRLKYGPQWWIRFLQFEKPTFLFERSPIETYSNAWGYTMTDDERAWFDRNYELVRKFEFKRSDYATSALARSMLPFSRGEPTRSCYVFRIRPQ
jgi:hypothetical protein